MRDMRVLDLRTEHIIMFFEERDVVALMNRENFYFEIIEQDIN